MTLSQIHGSRPAKKKARNRSSLAESRRGARPKRAWFFPSIQPSSHASDATDATDARERRRRNPMHRKYIDRSIDARVRADGPTRGALARFCAHAFDDTTDGWNDGWMDDDPRYIPFSCTNRPFVNRQISHGSGPPDRRKHQQQHPAVRACRHIHPTIQHTLPDDATRREYDDVPIDVFFLCNFNVRFRVT